MSIRVRPSSVCIEDSRLLLVRQRVNNARDWSLPGGVLEPGETIEQCLKREMKEETGLDINVQELLYLSDRFIGKDIHIVHVMLLVEPVRETPLPLEWTHEDLAFSGPANKLREIRMVPLSDLMSCGFPLKFQQTAITGFPDKGSYIGDFDEFFGEVVPDEQ